MINFVITEICNWKCRYCVFPNKKSTKHTTKEIIKKHIDYVNIIVDKLNFTTSVQGGEVGLVPIDILEYFFSSISKKTDVSTNGEFLKRNLHNNPIIKPKINNIILHVADDLTGKVDNYNSDSVCGIVDINKNPKSIREFINNNNHIYFEYIDYDNDITGPVGKFSYEELYKSIKDLDNVSDWAKERLLNRFNKNLKECQNLCMSMHPVFFVDLVNETIPLCMRNYMKVYKSLTKYNLIKTIKEINTFDYVGNVCRSCIRICQDEGVGLPQIKNKLLYRSII